MTDIGRKLLQSVGFASPDDASISLAIEANDAFIARLEAIRAAASPTESPIIHRDVDRERTRYQYSQSAEDYPPLVIDGIDEIAVVRSKSTK